MSRTIIEEVKARAILDSRGNKTVEVDILTASEVGRAAAPSGASTGKFEVQAYPEGGVDEAVKKVNQVVNQKLKGIDSADQRKIDTILTEIDGTPTFTKLGGNTAYAISVANSLAAASARGIPLFRHLRSGLSAKLPYPLGNVLGGGMHAKGDRTDIQEYLALPVGAENFAQAAISNATLHKQFVQTAEKKGFRVCGKGDEGAWVTGVETEKALEILTDLAEERSDSQGFQTRIGMDVAASSLWDPREEVYNYPRDGRRVADADQIDFILNCIKKFRLVYVEDPLREDAFQEFAELTRKASGCLICGDDLFTTNVQRLRLGIESGAGNAIIIKPNQIGTLTAASDAASTAEKAGYTTVMSHRSGEATEGTLAHIAVGFGSAIIKAGIVGGERTAKINELIRIEEILGHDAKMVKLSI